MMKLQTDGMGRIQISIGSGKIYSAKSHSELNQAVEHYFFILKHRKRSHRDCPFCKAIRKEEGGN